MGTLCLQCGDRGFDNAFVYCVKCLEFAVHRYCLDEIPKTLDEFVRWICDDCSSKVHPHTTKHYGKCHSQISEEDKFKNEMAVAMAGDAACQPPESPLLQISGPMDYVDANTKEHMKNCFDDGGESNPKGTELMGNEGSNGLPENSSVQLSEPIHCVDESAKERTRDCLNNGDKSGSEGTELMGCDGSSELPGNPSVQLSRPMDYVDVSVKEYMRSRLDDGDKSDPKEIELRCGDGSGELPESPPVQLSGLIDDVDMHIKECTGGDGDKSNSKDIELAGGDGSSELRESSSVQLSRPVGYVDVNVKEGMSCQFDNGDKSDLKDIELMGGDGSTNPPGSPPVQPSGPMDYSDENVGELTRDHFSDVDKSDPDDIELMGGDRSNELPESVPVQLSGPVDYVDFNVNKRTRGRFDDGDNSDPEDIELDDGKVIPDHERIHLDFDLITMRPRFTKEIGRIVAMRYQEPWISFKEIPSQEVEVWWHRFQQKFRWDPKINLPLRKEFNRRCREFLVRHLRHARQNNNRPSWIKEDQWAAMCTKWESKKKCETSESEFEEFEEWSESSQSKRMKKSASFLDQSRVELQTPPSTTSGNDSSSPHQTIVDQYTQNGEASAQSHVDCKKLDHKTTVANKKTDTLFQNLGGYNKKRHYRYEQQMSPLGRPYVVRNEFLPWQDFNWRPFDQRTVQAPTMQFFRPLSMGSFQLAPQMQPPPRMPQWEHGPYANLRPPQGPSQWHPRAPLMWPQQPMSAPPTTTLKEDYERASEHKLILQKEGEKAAMQKQTGNQGKGKSKQRWHKYRRYDCKGNLLTCHKCKRPGHFARECAWYNPKSKAGVAIPPEPVHQVCHDTPYRPREISAARLGE